ncbi:TPA: hypothetical protein ACS7W9_002921 [Providencia alcalifaciens]
MQDLMPPINTQDSIFHDGDPTTGQLGTIVTALWLNNVQAATRDVQAEIKNVLAKAGMTPDPKKNNQLADAISQIVSSGNYASTAYVDNGLNKKIDKASISSVLGNDNSKVPSLGLLTTELGKKQPAGNYQPAGDYATNTALSTGLAGKLGTDAIVQSGGQSTNVTMSQKAVTDMGLTKLDRNGGEMTGTLITPRVESNKLTGDNKQILNASGATVYLGNTESVAAVRLESNNGAAYVTRGSEAFRIFHQGFKPSASDVDAISTSMSYALVPIGASVIWNTSAPIPSNFWANEGRSFSATEYPEAAKAMPDLKVPDDRGYAIRAADNGRGIDTGRTVGTYQQDAMRNLTGSIIAKGLATTSSLTADGVFRRDETYKDSDSQPGGTTWVGQGFTFDASRQVSVANEFRMKNVAKILITRMK